MSGKEKESGKKPALFKRIFSFIGEKYKKLTEHPALFIIVSSFLVNMVIEMLSRHSVWDGFMFIFRNPIGFLFGMSIIAVSLLPSLLFKKRYPVMVLLLFLWVAMGITNLVITLYRLTPFTLMDFTLLKASIPLLPMYLGIVGLILSILAIIGAVVLIVVMFIKMKSDNLKLTRRLRTAVSLLLIFGISFFTAIESGAVATNMTNIVQAYSSYGFTYCFTAGIFSRGVSRPTDYSTEAVDKIYTELDDTSDIQKTASKGNPNIIILQLESFYDVSNIKGIEFSENPIPNFTQLRETCPHGSLRVPSIGGGTANTEFEVLTGMNTAHFGMGEYPYKTVLHNNTCESICYNLKNHSYSAHAIHNHYATFYDRDLVYRNLGFDTFTPVEYMPYVPTTYTGWEKDEILPYYIKSALASTDTPDIVFTVTVEGHGAYPTQADDKFTPAIRATTDGRFSEQEIVSFEYYATTLLDTDKMIGELTEAFRDYDEPVMIVLYGDHLPGFDITDDDLTQNTVMDTEYVIWTNYDSTEPVENSLSAYQLSAYVMQLCGKSDGIITKVHQAYGESDDYDDVLEMLEYSMLYDKSREVAQLRPSYEPTEMKLGISDITVTGANVEYDEEAMRTVNIVHGTNFTPWSVISVNGTHVRTVFKSESALIVEGTELAPGDVITVSQIAQDMTVLSVTDEYVIPEKEE